MELLQPMKSVSSCTELPLLYMNKLKSDLKTLKPNKTSGPDGISSRSLAVAGSSASDGLLMVFHYSIASSRFPVTWKLAKVHAIHKKGSQADVSNKRPISLLSIPSKLLESQICSLIDNHLNSCGTKSCKQWGFTDSQLKECSFQ